MTTNLVDYSRNVFSCSSGGWEFALSIPGPNQGVGRIALPFEAPENSFLTSSASGGCWLLAFLDPWPFTLVSGSAVTLLPPILFRGLPRCASGEDLTCQCRRQRERDAPLIPGSGRSPGEGHGSPLQYSCQENSMDRGAGWPSVYRVTKSVK